MDEGRLETRKVKRNITEEEEYVPHEMEIAAARERQAERRRDRETKQKREEENATLARFRRDAAVAIVSASVGAFILWLISWFS